MQLGDLFQLVFGLTATILALVLIVFKWNTIKGKP
jgi:hypothetical protein